MAEAAAERAQTGRDVASRRRWHRPIVSQTQLARALAERDPDRLSVQHWVQVVVLVESERLLLPEQADYERWIRLVDEVADERDAK